MFYRSHHNDDYYSLVSLSMDSRDSADSLNLLDSVDPLVSKRAWEMSVMEWRATMRARAICSAISQAVARRHINNHGHSSWIGNSTERMEQNLAPFETW